MSKIMSDARQQQIGELKDTINNLEHSLDQARNENLRHLQRIAELERRINLKDEQLQTSIRRHTQLRQRVRELQAIDATCRREIQRLMDAVNSKNREIDVASFGFAHAKQRITQLQTQQMSLKKQIDQLKQVIKQQNLQLKEQKSSSRNMFQVQINKNISIDQLIKLLEMENHNQLANQIWVLKRKVERLESAQGRIELLLQQNTTFVDQNEQYMKIINQQKQDIAKLKEKYEGDVKRSNKDLIQALQYENQKLKDAVDSKKSEIQQFADYKRTNWRTSIKQFFGWSSVPTLDAEQQEEQLQKAEKGKNKQ